MTKPVQVSAIKFTFDCPDCGKQVNFIEAYKELPLGDKGEAKIAVVCPYCDSQEVAYYTNNRIRSNQRRLRDLRNSKIPGKSQEYQRLQRSHQKYFDKFNRKMKEKYGPGEPN